ncbi:UPF0389 protein CG9231 [Coccinella septempunctata]|uniref:UPF0389 protein CG9231 n=1 Tax=Coccinella septempunctata TaxID=41139 RepID=UPI001D07505A|nr:UPF0389 protein CG9231 [Coccinella septempunctata]
MGLQRYFLGTLVRRSALFNFRRNMVEGPDLSKSHRTTNFEKKILVWTKTGNYKSVAEVPEYVGQQVMEKGRNRMRIRVANIMMALTALGCISMVILGKRAHERGESVEKMGEDWHREIRQKSS